MSRRTGRTANPAMSHPIRPDIRASPRPSRSSPGFPSPAASHIIRLTMERRKFGNTNLDVSAISLGCWPFGVDWWGHYTDEAALKLCQFAYDHRVTFFDNGDAYGNGRAATDF